MLGIDGPELLVIIVVIVVVVRPKDLPRVMRALGRAISRLRMTAQEFRDHFDAAMHDADMRDITDNIRRLDPECDLKQLFDPFCSSGQDIKNGDQKMSVLPPVPVSLQKISPVKIEKTGEAPETGKTEIPETDRRSPGGAL